MLDLEELLATRLLVQGNSGSGKSHLLRRLLEQSAALVQQAIIDPEGDFVTLADKFGHVVVDAAAQPRATCSASPPASASIASRWCSTSKGLEVEAADALRRRLPRRPVRCGARLLVSRCWWWSTRRSCSRPPPPAKCRTRRAKLSLGAMTNLMCRGRKRGLAGVIATQRLAKLAKNVAAEASNFLMGRTFLDIDMARAADLLGMERRQAEMFRDLERGHFVALGPALSRRPLPMRIGEVETSARTGTLQADAAARAAQGRRPRPDLHRRRGRGRAARSCRAARRPRRPPADQRPAGPARPHPAAAAPSLQAGDDRAVEGRARGDARRDPARDPRRSRGRLPHRGRALSGFPRPLPHPPRGRRAARTSTPSAAASPSPARASTRPPPQAPNGTAPWPSRRISPRISRASTC